MPPPDPPTWACRRDHLCDGRTQLRDPDTGALLGWEPGRPTRGRTDGLCTTCEGRLDAALTAMPRLLVELTAMLGRDTAAAPLDPTPTGGSKTPPIPLRVEIEAARTWLDREVCTWAGRVGSHLDTPMHDAGPQRVEGPLEFGPGHLAGRLGARVQRAVTLLQRRTPELLDLPAAPTPVHSPGADPTDRADPDLTTISAVHHHDDPNLGRYAARAWGLLDGTDGAALLIDVDRRARQVLALTTVRTVSVVGCTRCGWPYMTREPGQPLWRCPRCPHQRSDDDHDVLRQALTASGPQSPPVAAASLKATKARLQRGRGRP